MQSMKCTSGFDHDSATRYIYSIIKLMIKSMWENTFAVFVDFLQTTKAFPNNFTSAISSINTLYLVKKQNCKSFSYIVIKSNEVQNFSLT